MSDSKTPANLLWFRDDLRLGDNPSLNAAIKTGAPLVCLYILEQDKQLRPLGGAAKWWLHHALAALHKSLQAHGQTLILRSGNPAHIMAQMADQIGAKNVFWNRRYAPDQVKLDAQIKTMLEASGHQVQSFNGSLLHEPWSIKNGSGQPYRVFTPFWRACQKTPIKHIPIDAPPTLPSPIKSIESETLNAWHLRPYAPDWAAQFPKFWTPGEAGAQKRLDDFIVNAMADYAHCRDIPAGTTTSGLSPHLRFGEISPRQIYSAIEVACSGTHEPAREKFLAEIGWREFSKSLAFYAQNLAQNNWRDTFDAFQWRTDSAQFNAWCQGQTGYPLIDAGMRQLWKTGWVHNRVRMVVASFLVKHLLINWQSGEKWFWDTLVDADIASNPAGWQWVAGTGADAAPFFRIFNPTAQAEKFDPHGHYIRQWVPELTRLPDQWIHKPWAAPDSVQRGANIVLGSTYPTPIVDHKAARERALAHYKDLKK